MYAPKAYTSNGSAAEFALADSLAYLTLISWGITWDPLGRLTNSPRPPSFITAKPPCQLSVPCAKYGIVPMLTPGILFISPMAALIPPITLFTNPFTVLTSLCTAPAIPENTPDTNPVRPLHADFIALNTFTIKLRTLPITDDTVL